MKTLSEQQAERARETEKYNQAHTDQCRALLDASKDVPVFNNTDPVNVTEYAKTREMVRSAVSTGEVVLFRAACDHCGTELVNYAPNIVLTSYPPQQRVGCPGCGWIGSTSLF